MNKIKKTKILDAWTALEILTSGKFDKNGKLKPVNLKKEFDELVKQGEIKDDDFYTFLKKLFPKYNENNTICLFFGIFRLNEINIFKNDEIKSKFEKQFQFSIIAKINYKIEFTKNDFFIPEIYYLKLNNNEFLPNNKEKNFNNFNFYDFKKDKIQEIYDIFQPFFALTEFKNESNEKKQQIKEKFNECFGNFLKHFKFSFENSYYSFHNNNNNNNLLNSFFIDDLIAAKKLDNVNLDKYIENKPDENRINLETDKKFENFAEKDLIKLLQPKFYPRGRFPSEPTKALSLMQQVVVNIAINEDFQNLDIKSVNGPPGTGKTTLLKEVFAELAVRQSFEMARSLQAKKTQQSELYKSGQIGVLDEAIAKYGILVASSNNSAVNNIVEEFPKFDSIPNIFKDLLINANYFADISKFNNQKDTSSSKNWGLFSYKAGKYENIQELLDLVNKVVKSLEDEKIDENEEVNVINDFLNSYSKITDLINEKQKVYEIRSTFTKSELDRIEKNDYNFFNTQIEFKQEKDDLLASVKFYEKKLTKHKSKWNLFLKLFSKKRKKVFQENEKNVEKWKDKIKESQLIINNIDKGINKILKIEHLVNELLQKSNKSLPKLMENYLDLSLDYEKLNLHTPWFDDEFRKKQTELFIKSLKVRKIFIDKNKKSILKAVKILSEKNESDQNCLITAWKWINLVIPVISTTFASLGNSMFRKITIPFIPNLFIDEAGQATPWSGVGAFLRAKKIMVIGDPSQIEPVVSLNEEIQKQVSDYFQLSNSDYLNYISAKSSIQTLADNISKYGHYYQDWSIEKWVGIPLVVHRRCTSPIFDIFNKISYNERMIQTIEKPGTAEWINVVDTSHNKNDYFVEKDFNITKEKIRQLIINDKTIETDDIFIITPFTEIKDKILEKLRNEAKEDIISEIEIMRKISKIMRKNTGTIHTFQGREAKIVFLILGHIEKTKTFDWAMGNDNPNIINVAVSRAKEQLYVIGNKNLFCRKNTDDKNKNTINHCSNVVRVLIEKTSNVELDDDKNKNY